MNNSVALLYNFNEEKLKMIKMVCMMMQVRFKEVARAEYEQPLGALLGISGIENHGEVYQGEEFQEEMLVLHGFDGSKLQKFLIALQRVGVGRIELKAMITENNKSWNGLALYEELCQEREALRRWKLKDVIKYKSKSKTAVYRGFTFFLKYFQKLYKLKLLQLRSYL